MFKLGLIINPLAGIGGPAGLKGSDGDSIQQKALAKGYHSYAKARSRRLLDALYLHKEQLHIHTCPGDMGERVVHDSGFHYTVHDVPGYDPTKPSSAAHSRSAAHLLYQLGVDLLVFVGGDGTARDIFDALKDTQQVVLGLPAGVKIHSSVYTVNPEACALIIKKLLNHELLTLHYAEIRDIDEQAFRENRVQTRFFGELLVPLDLNLVQQVKQSPRDQSPIEQADIAAFIIEQMQPHWRYVLGPGSSTLVIMEQLGLEGTLLGVDIIENQQLLAKDVDELELFNALHPGNTQLIITATGQQGHIIGRGNQQLSPRVLRAIGRPQITLIASSAKLRALNGRPLWVDSNDVELNQLLRGYWPVVTGYDTTVLYPVA